MPWLIVYLIKCSLSLACLYLFYLVVLRPLTFYRWNRIYLVGYSLLSFLLPFIDISPLVEHEGYADSALITAIPTINSITAADSSVAIADPGMIITSWDIVISLFISGVLFMLFRFLMQWLSLQRVKRSASMIRQDDIWLYDVPDAIHPFSFGSDIFINSAHHSDEELKKIIQHEFVHVKQQHSIDLIIAELLCIFNWYNPFAWLIRKAIRDNLEFIADNQVLESGTDAQQYQLLLLKVMGLPQYSITNQFSFSSLKKRIAMMNKLRSAQVHLVKFLFLLPLCAVILLAFRNKQNESRKKEKGEVTMDMNLMEKGSALHVKDTTPPMMAVATVSDMVKRLPGAETDLNGNIALNGESVQKVFVDGKGYSIPNVTRGLDVDTVPVTPVPRVRQAKELPKEVKSIRMNDNRATVTYKNGKVETYNFESEREKGEFDEKWGAYAPPPPPVPPLPVAAEGAVLPVSPTPADAHAPVPPAPIAPSAPPAPPALPAGVASMNVTKEKITLRLKNGNTETYDMNNADQKAAYYRKYGKYPSVPHMPSVPHVPASKATPPVPPVKAETNGLEQVRDGSYLLGKDALIQVLAEGRKKGEIYIGISNPLDINIDHVRTEDIVIEFGNGTIRKVSGIFYALPTKQGMSKLIIFKKEKDGSKTLLKSLDVNVKRLPDPATLKNRSGSPAGRSYNLWPNGTPWTPVKDDC